MCGTPWSEYASVALTCFDKYLSLILKCLRDSSLCCARLCCLLSLTHLAIQRRDWLRQTSDGEYPSESDMQKSIETLLAKHTADYDHRIRIRALDCLSARLRLVDHAFSKICYAMQDISVSNRVEAAKLLGDFRGVSDKFLEQTLDKKFRSGNPCNHLFLLQMTRDSSIDSQSNEWATGRMFGADAPAELLDGSYIPLIDSESCGAFIAGLEDEHMDVRNASIDSVSSLAMENKEFAQKCLDFLVDMFNDEIDEVRLNAIKHLARLCPFVTVGEEQLRSIYNGLVDSSPDSREAIREVLACCRLESSFCLELTLNALTNNLARNPEDKFSVWNCAKQLGSRLSGLVLPLACDLLAFHPYYEGTEPKINDPCYIAKLILVLNAAKHCPTIMSSFLNYTWNHYEYLRVNCPTLVPNLRASIRIFILSLLNVMEFSGLVFYHYLSTPRRYICVTVLQNSLSVFKLIVAFYFAARLNAPSLEVFAPFVSVHSDPDRIQWTVGLREIVDAMKTNLLHPTVIRDPVVRLSAVITEPSDNANVIYRFAGSLILAIPLAANLYGFDMDDVCRLRVRLIYPDTTVKLFKPRKKDFTDFLPTFIRLRTNVLLTAPAWTDSAPVELSVVLLGHRILLLNEKMQSFSISNSVRAHVYPKLI
ncbi:integrator complex subunit 4 [Trichuris trichiura]|uniref:Integrator complex subunit 4 n=1 Tax=Trichuris trichiura TaxID=36087 RepID=A0A077ZAB9_TRITR|nr:integrator complex subunit 4 [Trichuris trichiura]